MPISRSIGHHDPVEQSAYAIGQEAWRLMGSEPEAALAEARRAVEADPGRVEGCIALAGALVMLSRLDEAIALIDEIVFLYPELGLARTAQASMLLAAGQPDQALQAAEAAVRMSPYFATVHSTMSSVRKAVGDVPGALRSIQRAIELRPQPLNADDAWLLAEYGRLLVLNGARTEGLSMYERAHDLHPADEDIRHALEQLR